MAKRIQALLWFFGIYFVIHCVIFTQTTLRERVEHKHCQWVSYKYLCHEPDADWPVIDIVYTWVNGSDPILKQQLRTTKALQLNQSEIQQESDEASASRFADNEELRYSLRSIEKFAPWVRHIYLVTNGQVPHWLDTEQEKLTIITHSQIFPNQSHLPTFSSPAIETHLHRIPRISNHFIYFNDDVMLGAPTYPDDFKSMSDGTKVYLSWAVPTCNDRCTFHRIGDGFCDDNCNVAMCHYDGGDCEGENPKRRHTPTVHSHEETTEEKKKDVFVGNNALCAQNCPTAWIGDGHCDNVCEFPACGFDGGDCTIVHEENEMHEIRIHLQQRNYILPKDTHSLFVDVSGALADDLHIINGAFDRVDLVRTATLSADENFFIFTFYFVPQAGESIAVVISTDNDNTIEFTLLFHHDSPTDHCDEDLCYPIEDELFTSFKKRTCTPMPTPHLSTDTVHHEHSASLEEITHRDKALKYQMKSQLGLMGGYLDFPIDAELDTAFALDRRARQKETSKEFHTGRKLQDTFGDSLRHVDYMFSKEYGYASRKVPAHMPHMINKGIMSDLQDKYSNEWNVTSSHQLRQSNDMQYAFSYFYYLINHQPAITNEMIFSLSDVDSNGYLDNNELRTIAIRAYGHPINQEKYSEMMEIFHYFGNITTFEIFSIHDELLDKLRAYYEPRYRYKYQTRNADDVGFIMVNQNDTLLQEKLDGIRERQHKFICLNDNIDHSHPKARETVQLVHDFYNSLVPIPCSFELQHGKRNNEQYIQDIIAQYAFVDPFPPTNNYQEKSCLFIPDSHLYHNNFAYYRSGTLQILSTTQINEIQ